MVELIGHLLEGPSMAAFAIGAVEGEIIVYHLVAHDIGELLLGKVVVVGNGDNGVIDVLVEPTALIVLEIAAGVFGGEQEIEIGSRKFSPEVFRVTRLENHWHIIVISYHIRNYCANIRIIFELSYISGEIFGQHRYFVYLCAQKTYTMSEELFLEDEIINDELEQVWIVAEALSRDIVEQLADLHTLKGAAFISMLKEITQNSAFSLLEGESYIYITGVKKDHDYDDLLNAARKAVEHGYTVYMLPNPKGFRTADFIFERKGVYKMYDLKTISGKTSLENRLMESIGQTNRVLLNMPQYNTRKLVHDIRKYFMAYCDAIEIIIFKGKVEISISRRFALSPRFYFEFKKIFEK